MYTGREDGEGERRGARDRELKRGTRGRETATEKVREREREREREGAEKEGGGKGIEQKER